MLCETSDLRVVESRVHAAIPGRVVGTVAVHLRETCKGAVSGHDLTIRSWANVADGTPESDIEAALLATAGRVLARVLAVAGIDPDPAALD